MSDEERHEGVRREGEIREGDGDEGHGGDEIPPFTPEQLQCIDRLMAARQRQPDRLPPPCPRQPPSMVSRASRI